MSLRTTVCTCVLVWASLSACDKSAPVPDKSASGNGPSNTGSGHATTPAPLGPRWVCQQPTIDFGEVWAGETVTREFTFRNVGTGLLEISRIKAHCSCSASDDYTKTVAPGGSGVIPFVLKTTNKPFGPLREYLTVETNDPKTTGTKIWLKGAIRTVVHPEVTFDALGERDRMAGKRAKPLRSGKAVLAFGKIETGDRLHRVVRLRNTSGQHPLTLSLQPIPANSLFQVEFTETTPGEEFELVVTADPPIPTGRPRTRLWFKTNVPGHAEYQLWASAYVPPRVEVSPPERMLLNPKYAGPERTIRIINNGTTPVAVTSIACSDPAYRFILQPPDPKSPNTQAIKVLFPGGKSYVPPAYGELIEIGTNDWEKPVIRIPVLPYSREAVPPRPADKPLVMHPVPISGQGG